MKKSQNGRKRVFYFFCLMIERSRAGSGYVPLTNGAGGPKTYGSGYATQKNLYPDCDVKAGRRGYPGRAGWRCDGGRGGHRHQHAGRFRREPRRVFRHRSRRNLAVQPLARKVLINTGDHRLNMELDPPKFIWAPVYSLYSLTETPHAFGPIYKGAIGQPR